MRVGKGARYRNRWASLRDRATPLRAQHRATSVLKSLDAMQRALTGRTPAHDVGAEVQRAEKEVPYLWT